jgi:hypothetical protein
VEGGDTLFFMTKIFDCWKLMFATVATAVNSQSAVATVTMTQTPTLQTRLNCHNHLPNKTIVREAIFSEWIVALNVLLEFIYLSRTAGVNHHAAFPPGLFTWRAGSRRSAGLRML